MVLVPFRRTVPETLLKTLRGRGPGSLPGRLGTGVYGRLDG